MQTGLFDDLQEDCSEGQGGVDIIGGVGDQGTGDELGEEGGGVGGEVDGKGDRKRDGNLEEAETFGGNELSIGKEILVAGKTDSQNYHPTARPNPLPTSSPKTSLDTSPEQIGAYLHQARGLLFPIGS